MADRRRFRGVVLVGVIAALAALVAPAGAFAVKAPGLASSAQYKAFVEYVAKMEERSTTPTSTETKNTFEAKLTAKETAAKHKANALFKRASEETKAEANEAATEQAERVRNKEEEAQEELNLETSGKLERVETGYHQKYERIVTGHKNREKALKAQLAHLRAEDAKTEGFARKGFQETIQTKVAQLTANREDEKAKRQELKAATGKQKKQIKTTAEAKEAEIAEAAEETVKKIDNHWNKQYLEKKAALNATRENRVGYLESKLEQGRAAIAAMPAT